MVKHGKSPFPLIDHNEAPTAAMLSILTILSCLLLIQYIHADNAPVDSFLVQMNYQWNGATCSGHPQSQHGYRFDTCQMSTTTSYLYNFTSFDVTTNKLTYRYQHYPSSGVCSGTHDTYIYTADGSCGAVSDGSGSVNTFAQGVTPWADVLIGGTVSMTWYNQSTCTGTPAAYYSSSYDQCQKYGNGLSGKILSCDADSYQTAFGDNNCGTVYYTYDYNGKGTCYNGGVMRTKTECVISSENFVTATDDDNSATVVGGVAIGMGVVAMIAAIGAIGMWAVFYSALSKTKKLLDSQV